MSDTLLMLFSYQPTKCVCSIDDSPKKEWRMFAARTFASSIRKGTGKGPLLVSSWFALRAGNRGWMSDFRRWAKKAHELGTVDRELLDSALFRAASVKLLREERLHASSRRFRIEFEETFGYPLSKSPLLQEMGL